MGDTRASLAVGPRLLGAGVTIPAGERRHYVTFDAPSEPASPDGDGGYTQSFTPLDPPGAFVQIAAATARDQARSMAGSIASTASHVLRGPYHPGVTTLTRITFGTRTFQVLGVENLEARSIDMELLCAEQVT